MGRSDRKAPRRGATNDDDAPPGNEDLPTLPRTMRAEMATVIDDAETEKARLASLKASSAPPRRRSSIPPATTGEIVSVGRANPLAEARLLIASGNEASAYEVLEGILRKSPRDLAARALAEDCHRLLVAKYEAHLGSLARVPRIAAAPEQVASLSLDKRAGFLLALVDGRSTLQTILERSGLAAPNMLRVMAELYERGVIAFKK